MRQRFTSPWFRLATRVNASRYAIEGMARRSNDRDSTPSSARRHYASNGPLI
jgi:hypothetical protein